ncbi:MAG: flavin reductase family protein [Anaerolineae bacterium]
MSKVEVPLLYAQRLTAGRPACLLSVRYKGQFNVMSIAWVMPLSSEPPLLGLAIHPACYTHDMLKKSQECVLNVPSRPLAEQVVKCGSISGAQADKIALTGLHLENGHRVQVPWINECLAHIECSLVNTMSPGDHTVFVVEIVGAWAEEAAFKNGLWLCPSDNEELQPLVHLGAASFSVLSTSFTISKREEGTS